MVADRMRIVSKAKTWCFQTRIAVLIIGSFILALSLPCSADAPGTRILDQEEFHKFFVELVFDQAPWDRKNLQIDNFSARPESLTVPAGVLEYRHSEQLHPNYLGKKILNLTILVDGKETGEVKMSGDLQLYGDAACLGRQMLRHSLIEPADVKIVRRNISMLNADLIRVPEQAVGKRLKSALRAGAILYEHLLEEPPVVEKGDYVTIQVQTENFLITVPGQAKEEGAPGDLVRVKNLMSRKDIFARVTGADLVEVDL